MSPGNETACPVLSRILTFARAHGNTSRIGTGACVEIDVLYTRTPDAESACALGVDTYRVSSLHAARIVLGY